MSGSRIRAVLFDFGGVLAAEGFRNGLLQLAAEQGLARCRISCPPGRQ
jgi:hypothetical protein